MKGGAVIREARRRAGLTQRELAERLNTTQSAIARLERGRTEPSYARVVRAVRACGLEFVPHLREADDSDWSVASVNLTLDHDARARQHQAVLRVVEAGRRAMKDAGRSRP